MPSERDNEEVNNLLKFVMASEINDQPIIELILGIERLNSTNDVENLTDEQYQQLKALSEVKTDLASYLQETQANDQHRRIKLQFLLSKAISENPEQAEKIIMEARKTIISSSNTSESIKQNSMENYFKEQDAISFINCVYLLNQKGIINIDYENFVQPILENLREIFDQESYRRVHDDYNKIEFSDQSLIAKIQNTSKSYTAFRLGRNKTLLHDHAISKGSIALINAVFNKFNDPIYNLRFNSWHIRDLKKTFEHTIVRASKIAQQITKVEHLLEKYKQLPADSSMEKVKIEKELQKLLKNDLEQPLGTDARRNIKDCEHWLINAKTAHEYLKDFVVAIQDRTKIKLSNFAKIKGVGSKLDKLIEPEGLKQMAATDKSKVQTIRQKISSKIKLPKKVSNLVNKIQGKKQDRLPMTDM